MHAGRDGPGDSVLDVCLSNRSLDGVAPRALFEGGGRAAGAPRGPAPADRSAAADWSRPWAVRWVVRVGGTDRLTTTPMRSRVRAQTPKRARPRPTVSECSRPTVAQLPVSATLASSRLGLPTLSLCSRDTTAVAHTDVRGLKCRPGRPHRTASTALPVLDDDDDDDTRLIFGAGGVAVLRPFGDGGGGGGDVAVRRRRRPVARQALPLRRRRGHGDAGGHGAAAARRRPAGRRAGTAPSGRPRLAALEL